MFHGCVRLASSSISSPAAAQGVEPRTKDFPRRAGTGGRSAAWRNLFWGLTDAMGARHSPWSRPVLAHAYDCRTEMAARAGVHGTVARAIASVTQTIAPCQHFAHLCLHAAEIFRPGGVHGLSSRPA